MKMTWFSGTTFRIQIGGAILVTDPSAAPSGIDPAELCAGADVILSLVDATLPAFHSATWRPRQPRRLIDEQPGDDSVAVYRVAENSVLVEAVGEAPVILVDAADSLEWSRWADGSVLLVSGSAASIALQGQAALAVARPRLVALAVADDVDAAFSALAPVLAGASLLVLEPGLAVEV